MTSAFWYNIASLGYFGALFIYIANLVFKRARNRKIATVTVALSFLAQTVGMVFRWHEAGEVEIAAIERAQDVKLQGIGWLVAYTQHPPWSNLYEIMVFMAWGIILVFLVTEVKWRIRFAGVFALLLGLTALGLASLTTDATIKPLVPALQSWWIMIHVISSAIGYAAGTMGAIMSLLYLVKAKERVGLTAVAGGSLLLTAFVFLIPKKGNQALLSSALEYRVRLLGFIDGNLEQVGRMKDGSFEPFMVGSPGVGILMLLSVTACVAVGVALLVANKRGMDRPTGTIGFAYVGAVLLSVATLALMFGNATLLTDLQVDPEIAKTLTHGAPAPWRIHVSSNQWEFALFAVVVFGQLFVALACLIPERFRALLPDSERLDRGAYYTILISFALVAVVLVTGALWAHYAWGRYWGWDPKETGALVIWLTYAIYLHSRLTYGWVGVPSAIIGIVGFFVILAGFLGVNLGWFADGLHSYGSA